MTTWLILLLALLSLLFLVASRSVRRMRRLEHRLEATREELVAAVRRRLEAAEALADALGETGYAAGAQEPLRQAAAQVAAAQDSGLRELAQANEQLKRALLQVYRALPRERLDEVRQAHASLAQAEDELDLARNQYNDLALHHNTMLNRLWYRALAPWLKASPRELFLLPEEEKAFFQHHATRYR